MGRCEELQGGVGRWERGSNLISVTVIEVGSLTLHGMGGVASLNKLLLFQVFNTPIHSDDYIYNYISRRNLVHL